MKYAIMRRIGAALTAVAVIFAWVSAFAPIKTEAAAAKLSDATTQKYEAQIAALADKQKALLNDLAVTRNKKSSALETKTMLDSLLSTTELKLELTEQLIEELDRMIEVKTEEIAQKEIDIEKQYNLCLERLRYSYEEGTTGYLEMILDSDSLSDFLSRIERVASILDYDKSLLARYEKEKNELIEAKETLEAASEQKKSVLEQLEADKADYSSQLAETNSYISNLEADESEALKAYYEAKAQEEKLDKELTAYLVQLQEKLNKQYVGGVLNWPIALQYNHISSNYGGRTLYGVYDFHGGIDISRMPEGTKILAANSGTVVVATYHYSYGNYIIIDHGGGMSTLYAHASKLLVSVNQEVTTGQAIAIVGSTGYSSGTHLHFEVRKNGVRQNPLEYVNQP